jgi:hypothetical protein
MTHGIINRNHLGILLTTILTLSMLFSNILLVQADVGGTGKYLEINFRTVDPSHQSDLLSSNCKVTATKVSSEQVFTYVASNSETHSQKVGAGTVLLEAIPDLANGWVFNHFVINGEEKPNFSDYKTKKYDVVYVFFDRLSWYVAASVVDGIGGTITGDGVNLGTGGTIPVYHGESATFDFYPDEGYYVSSTIADGTPVAPDSSYVLGPITEPGHSIAVEFELLTFDIVVSVIDTLGQLVDGTGKIWYDGAEITSNPATITIDYGSTPTFEFVPAETYHLSSVLLDNADYVDLVLTAFTQNYTFDPVKENGHSLAVTFSIDGQADIPAGSNITVFLSSAASLTFDTVGVGYASGTELPPLDPNDVVVWEITVVAELGDQIIVALRYDPNNIPEGTAEEDLRLYTSDIGDYLLFIKCDFDGDGGVDGQDVKHISNIIKHPKFLPEPGTPEYQEYLYKYDLDGDDDIDEEDIHVVNSYKNVEWIDITYGPVDVENNIIYGLTDHFSLFRCR